MEKSHTRGTIDRKLIDTMQENNSNNLIIAHSIPGYWLPITENWIWEQIHRSQFKQTVIADKLTEDYPIIDNLCCRERDQNHFISFIENNIARKIDYNFNLFRRNILQKLKGRPVVLFSHFGFQGYYDLPLRKTRHITRFYGFDLHQYPRKNIRWKKRYSLLFEKCNIFLTEGPFMKRTLVEKLGCPEQKIIVHNLGTDINGISAKIRQWDQKEPFKILLAGAFREKKGFVYALEAIGLLFQEIHFKNIYVDIVGDAGPGDDGKKYKENLLNIVNKYNLDSIITFHGFTSRSDLLKIALKCHIGIFPSVWTADGDCEGGYPVTILDVMATGLPVIGSTHCDIPEVVTNENGFLCKEKSIEDIAAAINAIYNNNGLLYRKSEAAFQTVQKRFSWNILSKQLDQIYTELICVKN